jgi:P pilus assembly chaperone PapD
MADSGVNAVPEDSLIVGVFLNMKPLRSYFRSLKHCSFSQALGLGLLLSPLSVTWCQAGGTVVAWGANDSLQSTVPASLGSVIAVAGGQAHSLALQSDGTVAAWGFNLSGQATVPPNLEGVTAIAAGAAYSMALTTNGTVVVWGNQPSPPAGLTNVVAIAAGWFHALALNADGTVVSWGSQTTVPGLSNVVAIAAGNGNSLALLGNGTVVAWGDDSYRKSEVPSSATNVMAIAAGGDHCLALQSNSTIVAWGRNDYGQATVPGGLGTLVGISAGALHSLALKTDGTVAAWGDDTYGQTTVSASSVGFIAVQAGGYHSLAIKNDGTPYILSQPLSQLQPLTSRATFSVFAIGTAPLSYQWQHEGTNLVGAVGSSLTLFNLKLTDSGAYTVKVTNSRGSVISVTAFLTVVGGAPLVSIPPQNQTAVCGDAVTFTVVAGGTTNLIYQWSFQGTNIEGATRSLYVLPNVSPPLAGLYSVSISNDFGLVVTGAVLTVSQDPPHITSALTAYGNQGDPFSYQITGMHRPVAFAAQYLPDGLSLNTTNGLISGTPTNTGAFFPIITAISPCSSDSEVLLLSVAPGLPIINGPQLITGTENAGLTNMIMITASGAPTLFGADNLPSGLQVDPASGMISGTPTFAGEFDTTIWASNVWGVGSANLHSSIANALIPNLFIDNVSYDYSTPYLLDFQFSLYTLSNTNDPTTASGVVVNPRLLSSVLAMEDGQPIGSESVPFISSGSAKLIKVELVLDFSESIASLINGDLNGNGISDAVDNMVAGALDFINQQASDTQIGVYEFHRDDEDPNQVVGLTTDHTLLSESVAGIWTNYVQNFAAGSRCWDAVGAAINDLGASNRDEEHFVVVISDGADGSSTNALTNVISLALTNDIKVFSVGFGLELSTNNLQMLSLQTQGRYRTATNSAQIGTAFAQITKDSRAQYVLRWATLKRDPNPVSFTPSFAIGYQGIMATSPPNIVYPDTNNPIIDTNQMPPTTNFNNITNVIIADFFTASNAGPVTVGSLRVVPEAEVSPTAMTLRSVYTPRYVRQIRIHYRPNWPCTPILQSSGSGEIMDGWSMTETDDGAGGRWLLLSSSNPADISTSIPFAAFGRLVTFAFQDIITPTNAFSIFDVDNTIYTNTGGQSFVIENGSSLIKVYPVLPHGTPVPWLIAIGYVGSSSWVNAELADPDGDGAPNWQEYWANTKPKDKTSKFVIRNVTRLLNGRFQITFSTSTNRTYRVEGSSDLINWDTVEDGIPGINQDVTVADARLIGNVDTVFYRVVVY